MSATKQHPGRVGLASVLLRTVLSASARMWISPFKGSKGAPTYFKDVAYAALRTRLAALTVEQATYMNPSTEEAYRMACKAVNFEPDSITLTGGVKAHWLGKRNADKLIVYLHGGGYCLPATDGLFKYLFGLNDSLRELGHDTTVVALGYTLAQEAPYPTQLKQAVELMRYLLELNQWDPSKITIGGDSAGGNLTLGVLSHILHPHPEIEPLTPSSPFNAAVLISPWVSFDNNAKSFVDNAERDIFDGPTLSKWSTKFLGGAKSGDNYSEPIQAPTSWWEGMEKVVSETLIWGGEWEVLIDPIREFATKFERGYGGKCDVIIGEKAAHEQMILDVLLGYKSKGQDAQDLEDWVKAKL